MSSAQQPKCSAKSWLAAEIARLKLAATRIATRMLENKNKMEN